jgi:CRP-like cAMP-binding protein
MKKPRSTTRGKKVLKRVAILSDLADDELEFVWKITKKIESPAHKVIMSEGEIGDSMYFFAEGEVDVTKNLTLKVGRKGFGAAEKSMTRLKAEHVSFFGDMAMFQNEPRSATITARTDCVLYEVTRDDFTSFCDEHPHLGLKILRKMAVVLSERIRKGNEDVLKLTTALSIALTK